MNEKHYNLLLNHKIYNKVKKSIWSRFIRDQKGTSAARLTNAHLDL